MAMTKEQWDEQQNSMKKKMKYVPTGKPGEVKMVEDTENEPADRDEKGETNLTYQNKKDWNDYLDWLKSKGLQGKPELDKGGLGMNLFKQYLKENPDSTINESIIPGIRKEYMNLRDGYIEKMKEGKMKWGAAESSGKEADYSGFMKHIVDNEKTANPNYVGQHLTMTPFPLQEIPKGETGGRPTGMARYSN